MTVFRLPTSGGRKGLLFPSDRLSWAVAQGEDFSYSSRTCQGNAPFNDVGLNFIPDSPDVDDDADHTAEVRHRIQGVVTAAYGDRGIISGKTTTVLCAGSVPSPHSIVTNFTGSTPGVGTTRCW